MVRAVRHNLQVIVRLAALLVLLGLGTVPVECAAVYGPHSIFISAEAMAQVRDGGHQHHVHGGAQADAGMASMAVFDLPGTELETPGSTALPAPAGTTVDALIAVAVFETDTGPGPGDHAAVSNVVAPLADNLLPAPEPPPPQRGS